MRHGFGMLISLNPSDVQMWFCEFRQVARPGSQMVRKRGAATASLNEDITK